MRDINIKETDKLFNDSIQALRNLMNRKIEAPLSEYDQVRVKVASTFIGNYPRICSGQAQANQVTLEILKACAKDQDQLREMIKAALPFQNIVPALPGLIDQNQKSVDEMQEKLLIKSQEHATEREQWKNERDDLKFRIMQLEDQLNNGKPV